jgi:phospho-N-acetylmuramoyl-pentapeptide-transferase
MTTRRWPSSESWFNWPTETALQFVVAMGVWGVLFSSTKLGLNNYSWNVSIPFFKVTADPTGKSYIGPYLYLALIVVVLLGSSNAVNLTDGLDGLAISVTFIAMSALTGFTYLAVTSAGQITWS